MRKLNLRMFKKVYDRKNIPTLSKANNLIERSIDKHFGSRQNCIQQVLCKQIVSKSLIDLTSGG